MDLFRFSQLHIKQVNHIFGIPRLWRCDLFASVATCFYILAGINPSHAIPSLTVQGRTKSTYSDSATMTKLCQSGIIIKSTSSTGSGGMKYVMQGAAALGKEFTWDTYKQMEGYFKKYCPEGW